MKYCPQCRKDYADAQRFCLADGHILSFPDPYHFVGRTLLEKYRIEALVGLGGMGAVYSAHHVAINRRVAVKILLPNLALGNEKMIAMFQREAETSGQLHHENIVDITDAGRTPDGIAYIVMEWLEGTTLDQEIGAQQQLGFARTAEIFRQVAAALDYAHTRRIVHRDLKPSNVMLLRRDDGGEQIKVVDFGIAKVMDGNTASPVSRIMGTPHYASPEQFSVGARIDGRADIYSLGVLLYQMLSGRLPFNAETPHELVRLQKTEPPPPLRMHRPDVPPAIEQLIERMLAKKPPQRPATAREAVEVFQQAIAQPDSGKTPTEYVPSTGEVRAPITVPYRETSLLERPVSDATGDLPLRLASRRAVAAARGKWLMAAAAAVILLLGGLWVWRLVTTNSVINAPSPAPSPAAAELMTYSLEVFAGDKTTRLAGDEPLPACDGFKFRFTSRRQGYLYIVAPGKGNTPMTFLTAQPSAETGVKSNFVAADTEFVFPGEDGLIDITKNEKLMAFTVIFAPMPLASPDFLTAPAMRELTATEQYQLTELRNRLAATKVEVIPHLNHQQSRVLISPAGTDGPVILDLLVKRK